MAQLFEPVPFEHMLPWDYRIRIEKNFKGYYHWHQCCEVLFVHEGRGTVVVNQKVYPIQRGMLFFFQPYQLHQVYADVSPEHPYIRSVFYLDPHMAGKHLDAYPSRRALFQSLCHGSMEDHGFDLGSRTEIMEWIWAMYEQARTSPSREDYEEMHVFLLQVLNCLYTDQHGRLPDFTEKRALRYSESIMQWIEEHYKEEITLERLAEDIHLSKAYVSRIFRRETGNSITDYITARRIRQACRLLETTTLPVERISAEVGFSTATYFIQLFKRVVGTTPLKYRRHFELYKKQGRL
ncbi:AraC family transcriptional regulator [Paenibacillus puerhi]|uniref:AraC family transcriptional regulator n=1 Tax=Paenibacillus puerhi TaxID=2692622 RepID=UPI001357608E|nr:AraC family transcriptional regulator [Paenibacillus puerhi]